MEQRSDPSNADGDRSQPVQPGSRRLHAPADQSEEAIIGETPEGTITGWNRGAELLYGYRSEETLGRSAALLYPPDQLPELDHILEAIRRGQQIPPFETVRLAKNGRQVAVRLRVFPIRDEQGRVVAASTVARELAGAREAEAALRRSEAELQELNAHLEDLVRERTQQLEAANKELEAFAYSVSHDLRAPLRAIDGFSAAVMEENRDQLDERGRHHLDRVRSAVLRMSLLIDALLNLSRISRVELQSMPMDLSACAREVLADLQQAHPKRVVEFSVQPGLVTSADPHLVRVLLENLLSNAWKFTRDTPQARIQFDRAEDRGPDWFCVRDNGAGFDMAYVNKLFGAFQRLHSAHQYEGTGIGLATVQRIVRRHGGHVCAEAAPGRGAAFYFSLPSQSGAQP